MKPKIKITHSSGNVFADLGFGKHEAQHLLLRSSLMNAVARYVDRSDLNQRACAQKLGITAPRLNDLLKGKIEKFSIDALVEMLDRVGRRIELRVSGAPQVRRAA